MQKVNRGKDFERIIKKSFLSVPNTTVDRINDQTSFYKGSTNICDFIVYHKPNIFYIECKTTYGNTLPFSRITETQWNGLLEKSKCDGVVAGIICWWIDKAVTRFISIQQLQIMKENGYKSVGWNTVCDGMYLDGRKKRIYFEYDMIPFLCESGLRWFYN